MVLGHMHFGHMSCEKYIFAFHMPLFFCVSGYLYKRSNDIGRSIKSKVGKLLRPYFICGIGYYLLWLIKNYQSGDDLLAPLKAVLFISVDGVKGESALWFLMVMFWAWLLYLLIDLVISDRYLRLMVIAVCSTIGILWSTYLNIYLPWGWQDVLAVQMFFLLGEWYRKWESRSDIYKIWEKKGSRYKLGCLSVVFVINALFIYGNGMLNVRVGQYPGYITAYVNALVAVWLYCEISKWIIDTEIFPEAVVHVLQKISNYSIVWLCINHSVIKISKKVLSLVGVSEEHIMGQSAIVLLTFMMIYVIAEIVMRTPLRKIFGRS